MSLQNLAMNEAKKATGRRECEEKYGDHDYKPTTPSILGGESYPAFKCRRCSAIKVTDKKGD